MNCSCEVEHMPKSFLFFDNPGLYSNSRKFYVQGSSPLFIKELINFIERDKSRIESIYLCLYLYNNLILDNFLEQLSDSGIKVRIVSIPLEGYDAKSPQDLYDLHTNERLYFNQTKFSIAERIYKRIKEKNSENFRLYIFPHMYIRSQRVKPFSRGNMPYSLHVKTIYIKYKDGSGVTGLTSSNLAARDMIKDEVMLLVEENKVMNLETEEFFNDIINFSYDINTFDENRDWLNYSVPFVNREFNTNNYYTAPFYKNSQHLVEAHLMQLLYAAKKRILICAQHICAYNYSYNASYSSSSDKRGYIKDPGLLSAVIMKSKEGLNVKCLSQTFVDSNGNSHNCRRPENVKAFMDFIREYEKNDKSSYAANSTVHGKYIIIDDTAIITTCNFTPTQFIYLDDVNIEKFDNIPNLSYRGIHSEVGQFIFIQDKDLCNALILNFESIWNRDDTYHHKCDNDRFNRSIKVCPKCHSELKKRNGKYGEFLGCSSFPKCKYTESI